MQTQKTDIIVVGQGIAGTMLSWHLHKLGIGFKVVDTPLKIGTSITVGTAIINPITGRRYVATWLIDTLLPYAVTCYKQMEAFLNIKFLAPCTIAQYFATAQMEEAFDTKAAENAKWLQPLNKNIFNNVVNSYNNTGAISPAYTVNMAVLINAWRKYLATNNLLIEAKILENEVYFDNNKIITPFVVANKIIWCNGIYGAQMQCFKALPFALNKGEFLIIKTGQPLPKNYILKQSHTIVPINNKVNTYWVGSSYVWKYNNVLPTENFKLQVTNWLTNFLKIPFTVIAHHAAERPANVERRPFVGMHPLQPSVGIFNGLGSKGCILAPYFANNFAQHVKNGTPILPEADVKRFEKIIEKLQ